MWAILTSKWGLAGLALALMIGVFSAQALRLSHAKHDLAEIRAAQETAKADIARRETFAKQISDKARADLSADHTHIVTVTKTLVQKVPVYVDAKADAACTVGTGFVSVFNAAARGETELPRPSGGSEGPASGVPLSAVLTTIIENDGIAYDWRSEALIWRKWYAEQRAAWNAR